MWPPLRPIRVCREHESVVVVSPIGAPAIRIERRGVRCLGLDVHKDFCEVAISDGGKARSAGRVKTRPADLRLFAESLAPDDRVVSEATGNALAIARILEP